MCINREMENEPDWCEQCGKDFDECECYSESGVKVLPRVKINDKWYFQDNRLREFRAIDDIDDIITFEEYRNRGLKITAEMTTTFREYK